MLPVPPTRPQGGGLARPAPFQRCEGAGGAAVAPGEARGSRPIVLGRSASAGQPLRAGRVGPPLPPGARWLLPSWRLQPISKINL